MVRDVAGFVSRARAALASPQVAGIRAAQQALVDRGLSAGVISFLQEVPTTLSSVGEEYITFNASPAIAGSGNMVKLSDLTQFLATPEGQVWFGEASRAGGLQPYDIGQLATGERLYSLPGGKHMIALGRFLRAEGIIGGIAEAGGRVGAAPTYGVPSGATYRTPYEEPTPKFYPEPRYEPEWYKFQEEKEFVSPAQRSYTERMFPSLFAKFEAGRAKSERQFAKIPFATEAEAGKAEEARVADWFAYLKKYPLEKEWWAKSEYERGERRPVFQPIVRTVKY